MSESDQSHGFIPGKLPAVVASYDKNRRECRVHIPGLTDGTGPGISAEIEYPIGDKSKAGEFSTDILILAGDHVWVEFECGDARYPIITGFRNPRVGNGTDWRRFHQDNIELLAVKLMQFIAGGNVLIESTGASITIKSPSLVTIDAPLTHIKGALTVDDLITGTGGISVSGGGGAAISGGALTHNGVNVGSDHTHTEQGDGADVSPPH